MGPSSAEEVDRLLARGGWELDDVRARHAANPSGFWIPPTDELMKVVPGSAVKTIFRLVDLADSSRDRLSPYGPDGTANLVIGYERMWLWVEALEDSWLICILMNLPMATHTRLVPGARVRIQRHDVIDVVLVPPSPMEDGLKNMAASGFTVLEESAVTRAEDRSRAPSISPRQAQVCARVGVTPQRPWRFARMLLGKGVVEGTTPVYGVRATPRAEKTDCGWVVWSGHSDMEVAAKLHALEVVDVSVLYGRCPAAAHCLALPPGWGFTIGPNGYEDLYEVPEALR